ncbi:methylated-DNA-[protein]-cysteine S-methyltransferase [Alkalibacterium subtropicum]|uniref:methylated-DNA--[protein]-cysteine S-methyltransferase n=1 Tax=Alkalibacterium subtropicum TaxID=753702 RepID=A0A1I1L8J3_9LACT|nr:methylated-DNA--[protein]-cysteine S-methyltransferase [Alkalibacterium subtropicum]SFC65870.1 methylated-DNA-[protein]-cysteine S-methyltransferase [Alkalibacterium subtropicum]
MTQTLTYSLIEQDDWTFYIVSSNKGLCFVGSSPASLNEMTDWATAHFSEAELREDDAALEPYRAEFVDYLTGEKQAFSFDTAFLVGTDFQKKIWNGLKAIPYGETLTYGELAASIGYSKKAARAVGSALAANPLLIVYPCHRVVPKASKPKAFRGGLQMKEDLLAMEQGHRVKK